MRIDGRALAETIYDQLRERVARLASTSDRESRQGELQKKGITPRLAVILVGEDPASAIYIQQKKLRAEQINAILDIIAFPKETTTETLLDKIRELNSDTRIHGIIVQRPLPNHINQAVLAEAIHDEKDVDGFKASSPFNVPVVMAVWIILQEVYEQEKQGVARVEDPQRAPATTVRMSDGGNERQDPETNFLIWLKSKHIVLLGKGSTAGKPIYEYLTEIGITPQLIDSKTENPQDITKQADIIISSVGKQQLLTPDNIKQGVILIGVGIGRDQAGKLHGDYDEEAIQSIASYYTPTPGGVGPLNVAMLMENLITATEQFPL